MLLGIGLVGYFGVREKQAVSELARIIDPVPEITDVLYLPTGGELQAISNALSTISRESGQGPDFSDMTQRYWKLETKLSREEVMSFYELESHRRGWSVVTQDRKYLQLRRERERLIVFLPDDWSPETSVWYIFDEASVR